MAIKFKAGKPEASQFYVEPGDYRCKVVEAKEDTSKAGNDMITAKCRVIREDGTEGPAFFERLVFTEKTFWRVDQFLKACGKHPGEGEDIAIDADDMIGWEFEATLTIEEYDGRKSNRIAEFLFDEF